MPFLPPNLQWESAMVADFSFLTEALWRGWGGGEKVTEWVSPRPHAVKTTAISPPLWLFTELQGPLFLSSYLGYTSESLWRAEQPASLSRSLSSPIRIVQKAHLCIVKMYLRYFPNKKSNCPQEECSHPGASGSNWNQFWSGDFSPCCVLMPPWMGSCESGGDPPVAWNIC